MALSNKRIIDLPERSALNSDDYTVVDGSNGGTGKYKLSQLQDDVGEAKQGVTQLSQTVTTQGQQIATNTSEIADLKEDLSEEASLRVNGETDVSIVWSQGGINGSGANNDNYTTRIRTNDYYDFGGRSLDVSSSEYLPRYQLVVYKYTTEKVFIPSATPYSASNFPTTITFESGYLYRLSWLDASGGTTASSDQINIKYISQMEYVPDVVADYVSNSIVKNAFPIVNEKDYCFECVHHDNFSRQETGWAFGQNSGSGYDVNNYEDVVASTVDTGFRVNNGLTCARDTTRTNPFSIEIVKANHDKNFMVELSAPPSLTHIGLAWDVNDIATFKMIDISAQTNYIRVLYVNVVNNSQNIVFDKNIYNTSPDLVQVYFVGGVCSIYFDDQIVASFPVTPFVSKVGIASYRSYTLNMSFINVFNIRSHIVFNPNYILDSGNETVPTTTLSANQDRYELSSDPTRWSDYAEHFTLMSTDELIYHGRRTERATNSLLDTNLRTVHYEFDVLFPEGYGFDTDNKQYHDSVFQFHDRESDLSTRGNVCFYLAVVGERLTVYMSSNTEPVAADTVTQADFETIFTIVRGKWYHIEIDQKERYEENQHPFTRITVDGTVMWESRKPNCYNDRRGSGLQYGIYKNNWDAITSMGRYFDNVKVVF